MNHDESPPRPRLTMGAMIALLSCGLFATIGLYSPSLVLPQIEQAFAQSPNAKLLTELIGSLAGFTFALGSPISGILIGRYGCRRVLTPALLIFAIAGSMPAFLDDMSAILACRSLLGFALSAIFTGALIGIGVLPTDLRVRMLGWFMVVGGLTATLMFPLVGLLGQLGWRPVFLVNLLALPEMALILLLPRTLGKVVRTTAEVSNSPDALLTFPMIRLLFLASLIGMTMLVPPVYGPLFLAELGVQDSRTLSVLPTVGSVCAIGASAAYGRLHHCLGIGGVFATGLLVMGLALAFAGLSTGLAQLVGCIALVSMALSVMAPNVSAAALAISSASMGPRAIGLANGVMFGAQLFLPFIATWNRRSAGMSDLFVATGIFLLMIGALFAIANHVTGRRRTAV